ncbi:basic blue protein-like [Prunus yedoensis var. nudiflora]|uniref:Basic blue protein-like n=1 Tax=Prunus yedoensis var. nudiflora TaxID=2094558 RepID=A0A314UNY8_PRUYE|nr:basic blue protein-like [Prunus yedoensis var. nudiflora]
MGQRRGSAGVGVVLMMCLSLLLLHSEWAEARSYTVGDAGGWTFNVAGWPKGKPFKAGDVLVFNYASSAHNVVAVNKLGIRHVAVQELPKCFRLEKIRSSLLKDRTSSFAISQATANLA